MARHEDVVNTIWDDLDHLSNDAFLLYVWSWTNLKCGMAGIYPIPRRRLLEGRLEADALSAALDELEADDKLFYCDGVLWNKARVSHLSGFEKGKLSVVIVKSIEKDLRSIDRTNRLLDRFLDRYENHPSLEGLKTVYRPSQEGHQFGSTSGGVDGHQTVQGQGQGQGRGSSTKHSGVLAALDRVAFARQVTSPKVEAAVQVCEQFGSIDLPAEAEKFAHYWIDGPGERRPISDLAWAWRGWLERVRPGEIAAATGGDYSDYDAVMEPAA